MLQRIIAYLFACATIITISCKKNCYCTNSLMNYCSTNSPLSDKEFIKNIINLNPSNFNIYKMTYNGGQGYQISMSQGKTGFGSYYDCDGKGLYQAGGVIGTTYPSDFGQKTYYYNRIYP